QQRGEVAPHAARESSEDSPASVWLVADVILTGTISPGSPSPSKLTTLLCVVRPRRRGGAGRGGPPARASGGRPTKRAGAPRGGRGQGGGGAEEARGALGGAALDHLDKPLHALHLDIVGDEVVGEGGCLGLAAWRVDERERAVEADLLDHLQGLGEVGLGLPREADDDVGGERAVRDVLRDQRGPGEGALPVGRAAHPLVEL